MGEMNIFSALIGAAVSIVTGLGLFFLTQVLLFQNKIKWACEEYGTVRFTHDDGTHKVLVFASNIALIQVRGWKPVRDVTLHMKGGVEEFEIVPEIPFKVAKENGVVDRVSINAMNPGTYNILIQKKASLIYDVISMSGVDAANATSEKRKMSKPQILTEINGITLLINIILVSMIISYTIIYFL
jgi:hypothetical protein